VRALASAGSLAALLAGCGSSAAPAGHAPAAQAPPGGSSFLDTSAAVGQATWAVAVMGGSIASEDNFWQLFVRPAGGSRWQIATPPGVADNGGLVLAGETALHLVSGFRPSQYLTFTPLTQTQDGGQKWTSAAPLRGALADTPDALAVSPAAGQLLALLTTGTAKVAAPGLAGWHTIATLRQLAGTAAGKRCGLQALTAAAYTPAGEILLAGNCHVPGLAAIFGYAGGTWQPIGPRLPDSLSREHVTIRRLTRTASGTEALLQAGPAASPELYVGRLTAGSRWTLSAPFSLDAGLASASFGPAGDAAIITTRGTGAVQAGPAGGWQELPRLPPGAATLAPGADGEIDALAVKRATLTVWRLASGGTSWQQAQVIRVPIQYGSSG
jgi:hypothetical protein